MDTTKQYRKEKNDYSKGYGSLRGSETRKFVVTLFLLAVLIFSAPYII
jgi:hypothetical protein